MRTTWILTFFRPVASVGMGGCHFLVVSGICGVLLLSACRTPGSGHSQEPLVAPASAFMGSPSGEASSGDERKDSSLPVWWKTFRDPGLDEAIESALAANLTVRQLASRLLQADARKRQAGARLFPSIDVVGDYARRDTHRLRGRQPATRGRSSSIGLLLDWEADVWGRLSEGSRAAGHEVVAARHDWLGGQLLLSASVAETYLEILEQRQLLQLLKEQVGVNETLASLTELRFGQGQASIVDILQQREQLKATQALFPEIEVRLRELEFSLDVLSGRSPLSTSPVEGTEFPNPKRLKVAGTPADLLQRRPDLLAARERVAAVDHRVAEAIADRFPRINLGASLVASGTPTLETLVSSLLAGLVAPVVDGGARRAGVDLRKAELEEAIEDYSQRYLDAIAEVEIALTRELKQTEQVGLLGDQLKTAGKLLTETRNRYRNGLTDYLPVLAAIQSVQRLERDLISSRRLQLSHRVAIHRALGGQS